MAKKNKTLVFFRKVTNKQKSYFDDLKKQKHESPLPSTPSNRVRNPGQFLRKEFPAKDVTAWAPEVRVVMSFTFFLLEKPTVFFVPEPLYMVFASFPGRIFLKKSEEE